MEVCPRSTHKFHWRPRILLAKDYVKVRPPIEWSREEMKKKEKKEKNERRFNIGFTTNDAFERVDLCGR